MPTKLTSRSIFTYEKLPVAQLVNKPSAYYGIQKVHNNDPKPVKSSPEPDNFLHKHTSYYFHRIYGYVTLAVYFLRNHFSSLPFMLRAQYNSSPFSSSFIQYVVNSN
jgi:hypothetical protein